MLTHFIYTHFRRALCLCLTLALLLSLAITSAASAEALLYGERNSSITQMQTRLKELGYFIGECTGYFGDHTKTAIENFQKANGLQISGLADSQTVTLMKSEDAVTKQKYLEMSGSNKKSEPLIDFTLKKGDSKKKEIKAMQQFLNKLGYYDEKADGKYDDATVMSVMFFQMANKLDVTGIADPDTLNCLISSTALSMPEYEKKYTLRFSSESADVRALQQTLKQLGYFTGECTAKFGRMTQDAVTLFQRYNNLPVTGECDSVTRLFLLIGKPISKQDAEAIELLTELSEGAETDGVRIVKAQLATLGYYSGDTSKKFSKSLTEAVQLFQYANSLEMTGKADTATRDLLNKGTGINKKDFDAKMLVTEVKRGDVGYSVKLLQFRLKELEYYSGDLSGTFDEATEKAVLIFQRGHQLEETGIADTVTREYMNNVGALTFDVAKALYIKRQTEMELEAKVNIVCDTALACTSKPYEGGKAGPDTFGNAGLPLYCFAQVDIELQPIAALQLEAARLSKQWNTEGKKVQKGHQVFLSLGDSIITGIYIGDNIFVYASPEYNMVIAVEDIMLKGDYKFIGSVSYF